MNDALTPDLPDFSDPLGVLHACHQRMLERCDTLDRLVDHVAQQGVDAQARQAAESVLRYFSSSAPLHHQDEEQDLFPLLNSQSLKLAELVHRLKQEHAVLDQSWEVLQADLSRPAALAENEGFAAHARDFSQRCRAHVGQEEKELLFMARHALSSRQLQELGRAMAKRRGLKT